MAFTNKWHKGTNGQLRKPKGLTTGGQWAIDPNGPLAQNKQAQVLGPHPESIARDAAKAAFKKRKKEAMDRFLAKQRAAKLANNLNGLPGPATQKRLEKVIAGKLPNNIGLHKKLFKLEHIAHRQGKIGFQTMKDRGIKSINPMNQLPNHKFGDKTPGGQNVWAPPGQWEPRPRVTGELSVGKKNKWAHGVGWVPATPPKGPLTLRQEKHERHVALRAAKEIEQFKLRKNIAAKRHNMKKKGLDFQTPPDPQIGDISPGGKFLRRPKRGARGRLWTPRGRHVKGTWQLIPTSQRAAAKNNAPNNPLNVPPIPRPQVPQKPVHPYGDWVKPFDGHPDWKADWKDMKHPDKFSNGVIDLEAVPSADQNQKGYFVSMKVKIVGDGKGILKTDGMSNLKDKEIYDLSRGFAYREVETYKISQMLGLTVVPKTEEFIDAVNPLDPRLVGGEYHSLQTFVPNPTMGSQLNDVSKWVQGMTDREEIGQMLELDIILGNTDRHGNNWLASDDHLYAIDNGLQMATDDTDAMDIKRGWRARHYLEGDGPRGEYRLSLKFRDRLKAVLDDGSLEKAIHYIGSKTTPPDVGKKYANAAVERAKSLYKQWDKIFYQ